MNTMLNFFSYKKIRHYFEEHFNVLVRFSIIGSLTALLYYAVFYLLWEMGGYGYITSVTIAYILSFVVHFTASRYYTFTDHDAAMLSHIYRYLIMVVVNYILTLLLMFILVSLCSIAADYALIIVIGLTAIMNYFIFRYWVFV